MKDNQLPTKQDLWQKTLNWQPSDRKITLFNQLYAAIQKGNQKQNLTRITEPEEFWEKHLWDSLIGIAPFFDSNTALAHNLPQHLNIIDIGTGAGFPGMPIAIAQPEWSVTMVDSTRKKIAFIQKTIAQLQLTNAEGIVARAETLGRQAIHREQYDLALIRAVGQAAVCAEYVLPLVKVGGYAVLYRGHWQESDTIALKSATNQLGSKIELIKPIQTPLSQSIRHCLYLFKHSPIADRFPRQVGIPNQQPIS